MILFIAACRCNTTCLVNELLMDRTNRWTFDGLDHVTSKRSLGPSDQQTYLRLLEGGISITMSATFSWRD